MILYRLLEVPKELERVPHELKYRRGSYDRLLDVSVSICYLDFSRLSWTKACSFDIKKTPSETPQQRLRASSQ